MKLIAAIRAVLDDLHSFADTVDMDEVSEWAASQPGQKSWIPPCERPWTSWKMAIGSVMTMSNKPSAKSFVKHCLSRFEPLVNREANFLCSRYVLMSLAIRART